MDIFPFPGGFNSNANGWLMFSVISALLYFMVLTRKENFRRTIIKTLAIGLLGLVAYQLGGPFFLIAALAFSALGDAFLAHESDKAFFGGLGSFLVAHIFYVLLFVAAGQGLQSIIGQSWLMAYAAAIIAGTIIMATTLWHRVGKIKIPVMVYILVIAAMGISATTLGSPLALLGTLLFIFSDTLLATEKFLLAPESVLKLPMRYFVWALYYIGQLFIALAFLI